VGYVGASESTTGRLIYKCGGVEKWKLAQIEKEAIQLGKASFRHALVMNNLKALTRDYDRYLTV
jgi:elongation factor 1-alpha